MINGIQALPLITALLLSYFSYLNFRRNDFTIREYLAWQLIWLVMILVTLYPSSFSVVSGRFGALRPLDLFTVLGFVLVISIAFYTYVNLDRLRKRLEWTIRELALQDLEDDAQRKALNRKKR